jgi:hypothetical protein
MFRSVVYYCNKHWFLSNMVDPIIYKTITKAPLHLEQLNRLFGCKWTISTHGSQGHSKYKLLYHIGTVMMSLQPTQQIQAQAQAQVQAHENMVTISTVWCKEDWSKLRNNKLTRLVRWRCSHQLPRFEDPDIYKQEQTTSWFPFLLSAGLHLQGGH